MNIIFEERNSSQIMIVAFFIAVVAFGVGVYMYWQGGSYNTSDTIGFIVAAIAIGVILFTFKNLTIRLYDDKLQFGFGLFKKTVMKGEIRKVEKKKYKFGNYLGYGIRRGMDKSWGYVIGGGEGIFIETEKQKFFFNTEKADELLQLIKQTLI